MCEWDKNRKWHEADIIEIPEPHSLNFLLSTIFDMRGHLEDVKTLHWMNLYRIREKIIVVDIVPEKINIFFDSIFLDKYCLKLADKSFVLIIELSAAQLNHFSRLRSFISSEINWKSFMWGVANILKKIAVNRTN